MRSSTIPGLPLGALLCAVAVAACGGSGSTVAGTGTNATGDASPVNLSKCMRANGLPAFPDPTNFSGGEGFNGIGVPVGGAADSIMVDGRTFSGPAAARAMKACARYLTPKGPAPAPTAKEKAQALTMARCMRANGVPSFPDPDFGGSPGPQGQSLPNPNTPAFHHAVTVCGNGRGISVIR